MEEEKGFSEGLVVWESLVLAGLILIWLSFEGNGLLVGSEEREMPYSVIVFAVINL